MQVVKNVSGAVLTLAGAEIGTNLGYHPDVVLPVNGIFFVRSGYQTAVDDGIDEEDLLDITSLYNDLLVNRVDSLESRVAALETSVADHEDRITVLEGE